MTQLPEDLDGFLDFYESRQSGFESGWLRYLDGNLDR
jgi:hypothetical protein